MESTSSILCSSLVISVMDIRWPIRGGSKRHVILLFLLTHIGTGSQIS